MKRVVTIELTRTYEFDEKNYPIDKYDDETIIDIAYEWWREYDPDIFIEAEKGNEG